MSNELNDFDQVFRDRLGGQTVAPPPAVWDNIQAKRTFGHIVANRISNNWGIFGTLLMLLLAGGSSLVLFGEEETKQYAYRSILMETTAAADQAEVAQVSLPLTENITFKNGKVNAQLQQKNMVSYAVSEAKVIAKKTASDAQQGYPSIDEIASLQQAGFAKPEVVSNPNLSAYIQQLSGWETAFPKQYSRYYNMELMDKKLAINNKIMQATPISVELDYDYVMPTADKKTFRQRSSFVIAVTPHTIHKTMRAKYNLSSSYLEDRKKAENTRLAYTVSGFFQYELNRNRFIETGINYTQIYEEMLFEGKKRFSNQYNFVEIPLLLGYQDRNAKWGWHVKGGLGVQIMNSYKGYILKRVDVFGGEEPQPLTRKNKNTVRNYMAQDHKLTNKQSTNEVANLEDEGENPFKTSGVINVHLAAGVTYFHNETVSFLITPSYRRSVNSITTEDAKFTEKLQYTGISFGTRVNF